MITDNAGRFTLPVKSDGDDNIQLKGTTNFNILVNGKTPALMARSYKEVLRTMPASSIKSIEVITDPPSKHDAYYCELFKLSARQNL